LKGGEGGRLDVQQRIDKALLRPIDKKGKKKRNSGKKEEGARRPAGGEKEKGRFIRRPGKEKRKNGGTWLLSLFHRAGKKKSLSCPLSLSLPQKEKGRERGRAEREEVRKLSDLVFKRRGSKKRRWADKISKPGNQ